MEFLAVYLVGVVVTAIIVLKLRLISSRDSFYGDRRRDEDLGIIFLAVVLEWPAWPLVGFVFGLFYLIERLGRLVSKCTNDDLG